MEPRRLGFAGVGCARGSWSTPLTQANRKRQVRPPVVEHGFVYGTAVAASFRGKDSVHVLTMPLSRTREFVVRVNTFAVIAGPNAYGMWQVLEGKPRRVVVGSGAYWLDGLVVFQPGDALKVNFSGDFRRGQPSDGGCVVFHDGSQVRAMRYHDYENRPREWSAAQAVSA